MKLTVYNLFRFSRTTRLAWMVVALMAGSTDALAVEDRPYVSFKKGKGYFPLFENGKTASLFYGENDHAGVLRAIRNLQQDIARVTTAKPALLTGSARLTKTVVVIGTLGKNPVIDEWVKTGKLQVDEIQGKWESFIIQVVDDPMTGVDQALTIVGSDKRGTIFGIYDLAQQIGVSPWFWWADVPVKQRQAVYVLPGMHSKGEPAVKYRGIFINDEQPALGGWVAQRYGGFNSGFYEKVFELILRMKGNFLWPAMWGQSFYTDDPRNPELADEYGIVIGTSHHEPMMRAHAEWKRNGGGAWNYQTNAPALREFWKEGVRRMGDYESIVTLAMRGDGDEPMSEESNVSLLQQIVQDQRKILEETTGKPLEETPQVWALYKEVQDYYDRGMRVPDDVTLLLCDDNWGNIRKLPDPTKKPHPGGYGIYYHYDYVGGPRNYKWLNTNPIAKVWEQMHLAYAHGATRIWIVNVGDIKPMEFPIEFFLDYAWDPEKWPHDRLQEYTTQWATREFGEQHASAIARIMSLYTKYNGRRKPELLAPDSFSPSLYSLVDYQEAERVVNEYDALSREAEDIYDRLPREYKDAYYQLILYPVKACATLNALYYTVRLNHLYAAQGRVEANDLARRAETLFKEDAALSAYYNETMSGGKWKHFMDQKHIGYEGWHDNFEANTLPPLKHVTPLPSGSMGIAIEGSQEWWPEAKEEAVLPVFDPFQHTSRYFDIFNRGASPFEYSVTADVPWIRISHPHGKIDKQQRIRVTIDWTKAPAGNSRIPIKVKDASGLEVMLYAAVHHPAPEAVEGFVESDGYIAIEAAHFTHAVNSDSIQWTILPDHGRTASALTPFPVTAASQKPGGNSPHVEYKVHFFTAGKVKVQVYLSPTINFTEREGLRYGVSFDDQLPQVMNIHATNTHRDWEESVKNNIRIVTSEHIIDQPGTHTLKYWMVDPAVVLQKIVVDTGGLQPSYLGPPESFNKD